MLGAVSVNVPLISIHVPRDGRNHYQNTNRLRLHYFNSCIPCGMQQNTLSQKLSLEIFQFMHPVWDATARFRYYIAIYTIFCIYILFFIQSYLIITSILFYLIFGNVRKKVFRYSSGLFNMIFHIVFISLQIRTFCFARVIAV